HPPPWRRSLPRDEGNHRLLEIRFDPRGGVLFGRPADFPDHDDGVGVWILREQFQRIDVRGSDERIATDTDAGGLSETEASQLVNRFVGERAALRDDTDSALAADVSWNDAGLGLAG